MEDIFVNKQLFRHREVSVGRDTYSSVMMFESPSLG